METSFCRNKDGPHVGPLLVSAAARDRSPPDQCRFSGRDGLRAVPILISPKPGGRPVPRRRAGLCKLCLAQPRHASNVGSLLGSAAARDYSPPGDCSPPGQCRFSGRDGLRLRQGFLLRQGLRRTSRRTRSCRRQFDFSQTTPLLMTRCAGIQRKLVCHSLAFDEASDLGAKRG